MLVQVEECINGLGTVALRVLYAWHVIDIVLVLLDIIDICLEIDLVHLVCPSIG